MTTATAAAPKPPRVYIETNFLSQLARRQEQVAACETILAAAEAGSVRLAIPAFALVEPWQSARTRRGRVNALQTHVDQEVAAVDLTRGPGGKGRDAAVASFRATLTDAVESELEALHGLIPRVAAASDVLPVTAEIFEEGQQFAADGDLLPPDAVLAAAILDDADGRVGPQVFLTTDRDFLALKPRFEACGVHTILSFERGAEAIGGSPG